MLCLKVSLCHLEMQTWGNCCKQLPTQRQNGNCRVGPSKRLYLVQPACEIDDNFSGSVVVNDLELTNVTWRCKWQRTSNHYWIQTITIWTWWAWCLRYLRLSLVSHLSYETQSSTAMTTLQTCSARGWPYFYRLHSYVTCISYQLDMAVSVYID